ncbi:SCP-like protein, partial [Oesophagostomum dentatum]
CDNTALKMTDANRQIFHDYLNEIRGKVAAGTAPNYKNQLLPAAKNMYKLLYDCNMELELQTEVDKCTGEATLTDYAQNMMRFSYANVSTLTPTKYLPTAMQAWYDPVIYYGLTNEENRYNDERLFTFAN